MCFSIWSFYRKDENINCFIILYIYVSPDIYVGYVALLHNDFTIHRNSEVKTRYSKVKLVTRSLRVPLLAIVCY
jgi:hypothetical protein